MDADTLTAYRWRVNAGVRGADRKAGGEPLADRSRTPAVSRAVAVLTRVGRSPAPLSASAIAKEIDAPRTSVQRICDALTEERLLERGRDGAYWLGPQLAALAASARLSAHHPLRYGLLIPDVENAYYDAVVPAARDDIRSTGGELAVRHADSDGERQRRQWQELLDERSDVILVDAVHTHGFDDLVVRTRGRGVPVVAVGTRIAEVDVSVISDNTQAGLLAGLDLARRLPSGGTVAIIDGLDKNANTERVVGFLDAMRDAPGITVVARRSRHREDLASGRELAEELLAAHPDLSGVFAVCDPLALGAAEYLKEAGSPLPIVSVDGRAQAVAQITAGGPIVATAAQDPARLIRTALECARQLHDGSRPPQRVVSLPVNLITAENARGYRPWG